MELSKRELRAVLLAGHITKKEQVRTNTGYLDSAKKNALIDELKNDFLGKFGTTIIENHGHVILSNTKHTTDFLGKLQEKISAPKTQDPKKNILQIVLMIILFKRNELTREDYNKFMCNFGTDSVKSKVVMSGDTILQQKTPPQLITEWLKFGWLISSGKKNTLEETFSWGPRSMVLFDPVEMVEKFRLNLDKKGGAKEQLYKAHFQSTVDKIVEARELMMNSPSE